MQIRAKSLTARGFVLTCLLGLLAACGEADRTPEEYVAQAEEYIAVDSAIDPFDHESVTLAIVDRIVGNLVVTGWDVDEDPRFARINDGIVVDIIGMGIAIHIDPIGRKFILLVAADPLVITGDMVHIIVSDLGTITGISKSIDPSAIIKGQAGIANHILSDLGILQVDAQSTVANVFYQVVIANTVFTLQLEMDTCRAIFTTFPQTRDESNLMNMVVGDICIGD